MLAVPLLFYLEGEADLPPVAELEKLGAEIKRDEQGEVLVVDLSNTQVSDAGRWYRLEVRIENVQGDSESSWQPPP